MTTATSGPVQSAPAPSQTPTAARSHALSRYHRNLEREHDFEALRVEGTLPADVEGTLYRNAPMIYDNLGLRYRHVFDGDGGIYAVRMADGKAEGADAREDNFDGKCLNGIGFMVGLYHSCIACEKARRKVPSTGGKRTFSSAEKTAVAKRWKASGLSFVEFAGQEGLAATCVSRWSKKF